MDLKVTEVTETSAFHVGMHMKDVDRREAFLSTGLSPLRALQESISISDICKIVRVRLTGLPIAVLGRATIDEPGILKIGVPWCVTTDDVPRYAKSFMQGAPHWVKYLQGDCDLLMNFCLPENKTTILWLKKVGFEFSDTPMPYGVQRVPFLKFWRYK